MTRVQKITRILATAAALVAFSAAAEDAAVVRATTGSHIDPNARAQMLEPIYVGGATEAARAAPLDASEAQAPARPQIGEIDAAQWLPEAPAQTQ